MRKLTTKISLSIDGFVCDRNGANDWMFKSSSDESRAWAVERIANSGLLIMGRKSFETMAPYWPDAKGPFAAPMNEIPKAVFTQRGFKIAAHASPTAAALTWMNAEVCRGDLAAEITRLKQMEGKPIYAVGGASFMRSLIETGLVDEYHLAIHPVVLGEGLSMFRGLPQAFDLKLAASKSYGGGLVVNSYHRI